MSDCTATSVRYEPSPCTHKDKRIMPHRDNCFWDPRMEGWVHGPGSLVVLHCTAGPLSAHKKQEGSEGTEYRHVTDGGVWWDSDVGSTPHGHEGDHEWGAWVPVTEYDVVRQCTLEGCDATQDGEVVV